MPISNDRAYVYLQLPGSLEVVTAGFFEQQERAGVATNVQSKPLIRASVVLRIDRVCD